MTALLLGLVPGVAHAAADVEGTWSFSGGVVVIQPDGTGGFKGTVTTQTRFSTCAHPIGEVMWVNMRAQPDGQYWGGHQWFNTSGCAPIATRGNTAWRVLVGPPGTPQAGKTFLRVCFAAPESPELQPTIAPDGTAANTAGTVGPGCQDSDLLAPPPAPPKFADTVVLPKQGRKKCLSRRAFRIRLKEPRNDAIVAATVSVNGRIVQATRDRRRITAGISLRGLPKGRYTVRIVATTALGRKITGTRKYRTCAPRRKSSNRIRV